MAWLAVDKDGDEIIFSYNDIFRSTLEECMWMRFDPIINDRILLPKGSIKRLLGRELTWKEEPVELK